MTYSIFASSGNLTDAFADRDAAVAALSIIAKADPAAAVFLVAQDEAGHFASEVKLAAS
jgi:hypothetical protein